MNTTKKLLLGATAASLCAIAPAMANAQTIGPISQTEYERAMFCIGKFEGGNDMVKNLRPVFTDKSIPDYYLDNNQKTSQLLNQLLTDTKDRQFDFGLVQGESARTLGRKPFDEMMKNPIPSKQWEYHQSNNELGKDCIGAITNLVSKMDKAKASIN